MAESLGEAVLSVKLDTMGLTASLNQAKQATERAFDGIEKQAEQSAAKAGLTWREFNKEYSKILHGMGLAHSELHKEVGRLWQEYKKTGQVALEGVGQAAKSAASQTVAASASANAQVQQHMHHTAATAKVAGNSIADAFQKGMSRSGELAEELAEKFGRVFGLISSPVGVATVALGGLGMAARTSLRTFEDFEAQMKGVQAVLDGTAQEYELLKQAALDSGAQTKFSATEAAGAIEHLAKAGYNAQQIVGGALKGTTDLAAAAGITLAEAAEIATAAMKSFNLTAEDLPAIADRIAAGANKSALDVDTLREALQQVGTVANGAKVPLGETIAVLAKFADSGLQGSDAGTSFRTMLQSLIPTSKEAAALIEKLNVSAFDTKGAMLPLTEIVGKYQKALEGMTDQQREMALKVIFGADAVRAAKILFDESKPSLEEYAANVGEAGEASKNAATRLDALKASKEQLRGAVETLAIRFGEQLAPGMRAATDAATWLFNALNDGNPIVTALAAGVAGLVTVITVNGLIAAFRSLIALAPLVGAAFTTAFGPVGWVVAGVAALAVGVTSLIQQVTRLKTALEQNQASLNSALDPKNTASGGGFAGNNMEGTSGGGGGGASNNPVKTQLTDPLKDAIAEAKRLNAALANAKDFKSWQIAKAALDDFRKSGDLAAQALEYLATLTKADTKALNEQEQALKRIQAIDFKSTIQSWKLETLQAAAARAKAAGDDEKYAALQSEITQRLGQQEAKSKQAQATAKSLAKELDGLNRTMRDGVKDGKVSADQTAGWARQVEALTIKASEAGVALPRAALATASAYLKQAQALSDNLKKLEERGRKLDSMNAQEAKALLLSAQSAKAYDVASAALARLRDIAAEAAEEFRKLQEYDPTGQRTRGAGDIGGAAVAKATQVKALVDAGKASLGNLNSAIGAIDLAFSAAEAGLITLSGAQTEMLNKFRAGFEEAKAGVEGFKASLYEQSKPPVFLTMVQDTISDIWDALAGDDPLKIKDAFDSANWVIAQEGFKSIPASLQQAVRDGIPLMQKVLDEADLTVEVDLTPVFAGNTEANTGRLERWAKDAVGAVVDYLETDTTDLEQVRDAITHSLKFDDLDDAQVKRLNAALATLKDTLGAIEVARTNYASGQARDLADSEAGVLTLTQSFAESVRIYREAQAALAGVSTEAGEAGDIFAGLADEVTTELAPIYEALGEGLGGEFVDGIAAGMDSDALAGLLSTVTDDALQSLYQRYANSENPVGKLIAGLLDEEAGRRADLNLAGGVTAPKPDETIDYGITGRLNELEGSLNNLDLFALNEAMAELNGYLALSELDEGVLDRVEGLKDRTQGLLDLLNGLDFSGAGVGQMMADVAPLFEAVGEVWAQGISDALSNPESFDGTAISNALVTLTDDALQDLYAHFASVDNPMGKLVARLIDDEAGKRAAARLDEPATVFPQPDATVDYGITPRLEELERGLHTMSVQELSAALEEMNGWLALPDLDATVLARVQALKDGAQGIVDVWTALWDVGSTGDLTNPIPTAEVDEATDSIEDFRQAHQLGLITQAEYARNLEDEIALLESVSIQTQATKNRIAQLRAELAALTSVTRKVTEGLSAAAGVLQAIDDVSAQGIGRLADTVAGVVAKVASEDYVGAIAQAFTFLVTEVQAAQRETEAFQKSLKDLDKQLLFADRSSVSSVSRERGGFLGLGTKDVLKVDEFALDVANTLEDAIVNGISNGFMEAIRKGDFSLFSENFRKTIGEAVLQGLIDAFIQGEIVKNILGPAVNKWIEARKTPGLEDDVEASKGLDASVDEAISASEDFYNNYLVPASQRLGLYGIDKDEEPEPTNPFGSVNLPSIGIQSAIATPILEFAQSFKLSTDALGVHIGVFGAAASLFNAATSRFDATITRLEQAAANGTAGLRYA
jgi:TP901 family phage tail tape measure protein